MKTVRFELDGLEAATDAFAAAWRTGRAENEARIGFQSPELLWKVLTAKRWELLQLFAGKGTLTIRDLARRLGRDVKAVHGDVHALLDAGVIERGQNGRGVHFPYDTIHVDFVLKAA